MQAHPRRGGAHVGDGVAWLEMGGGKARDGGLVYWDHMKGVT